MTSLLEILTTAGIGLTARQAITLLEHGRNTMANVSITLHLALRHQAKNILVTTVQQHAITGNSEKHGAYIQCPSCG